MLHDLLNKKSNWDKIAIIENDKEIIFHELFFKSTAIKSIFDGKSVNIAIMIPNGADFITALFGIIMSNNIAFPLNTLMTNSELVPLFQKASIATVITTKDYFQRLMQIKKGHSLDFDILDISQLNAKPTNEVLKLPAFDENKPMLLLSTSGTTDKCKIVELSEKNIESSVLGYIDKMDFDPLSKESTRFLLSAPFCSAYGIMIIFACLMLSFPIAILSDTFTLDRFYNAVERHRITNYEGSTSVIFLMDKMANRPVPHDISTLKYFGFGGSKISGDTIKRVSDAYEGMFFYQGYGMTEASPLIAKHPRISQIRADSVGAVIKGLEVKIEKDNEITSTPYEKGEIIVNGANVMLGYYKNKEATEQIIKNGYLHTGDIGYLDEDGYLYVCGRKKNIIIVRGYNVYPEEVEDCLKRSSLVSDCFVYSDIDSLGNETICADIVPLNKKVKIDELRVYLNKHLALYKHPQKINLCNSIKKNAGGKTERNRSAKI